MSGRIVRVVRVATESRKMLYNCLCCFGIHIPYEFNYCLTDKVGGESQVRLHR
jgi:hypothetical protein